MEYIAREAVRRYGDIEADLPDKLRRNIRRNFRVSVPREKILRLAEHYKGIYDYASSILASYLNPPAGKYVDWADVRIPALIAALRKRYPREPKYVIEMTVWYTVFYEYLK